jgi:iron complex transport system substrate-binding protein
MRKKRYFTLLMVLITFCLLLGQFSFVSVSRAAEISVIVNGNQLTSDVASYVQDGRVMVPFRAIFEALGATVDWDDVNMVVSGIKGGKEINLEINSRIAHVEGKTVELEAPAMIIGGRTFVPLRFVAESLGADVNWDGASQVVEVSLVNLSEENPLVNTPSDETLDVKNQSVDNTQSIDTKSVGSTSIRSVSVKDSLDHYVTVPSPPKRIVVCNNYVAEVICALGEEGRIVGAPRDLYSMPLLNEKLTDVEDVGAINSPSVEKIKSLKPDIVFGISNQDGELTAKIKRSGIPVVLLDCSNVNKIASDITVLGKIFQQEDRAGKLVDFINKNLVLVASRIISLPVQKKPVVYWEGMSDYSTCSADSLEGTLMELASVRNVAADLRTPWSKVTSEWVLAKNPEIIIKCPSTATVPSGYGESDEAMQKQRDDIMTRSGWQRIGAVKNGKVYVLSTRAAAGPQAIIGLLYVAKWLHPEIFQDIDPSAVHAKMLKEFYGLDYRGVWAYSGE